MSACRRADGHYAVLLLGLDGHVVREIALSDRGHDIAVDHAARRAVAFSRRPGTFAVAFATDGRGEATVFASQDNRTFSGHGVFSADGRSLYATETDADSGAGLLGVYDVGAGYRRIGEIVTRGIDPHEVILLGDGKTLVVANGGIEMSGREKLNIATMAPSLVYLDTVTGAAIAEHQLARDVHQLSIRHIAADARGRVWFGGQWEGALAEAPELVGRAGRDEALRLVETPADAGVSRGPSLKGYIGSVAVSGDGRVLAAAAPRAGRTIYIDTASGSVMAETALADGCGIAGIAAHEFMLSSGHGDLLRDTPGHTGTRATLSGTEFDNHLRFVGRLG